MSGSGSFRNFAINRSITLLATLAWLLCSCAASKPIIYTREGSTEQEFVADRDACTRQVKAEFNPYEDFGSPVYRSTESERMMGARLEVERLFRECMQSRGWRPQNADSNN